MKVHQTSISGALVIEPKVFADERGFFLESYSERTFAELGIKEKFVQDNHSSSKRGVLRGLHYQVQKAQGKLVRVISGEVLDVFVDLRRNSPTFGRSHSAKLSAANKLLAWIPAGLAHGFYVLSENADVLYKSTEFYYPELERTILWNDPDLGIDWGAQNPLLSPKDQRGTRFRDAETFA
jgi:dTDP-4-dehydrorhamnose 3,5-epimerase